MDLYFAVQPASAIRISWVLQRRFRQGNSSNTSRILILGAAEPVDMVLSLKMGTLQAIKPEFKAGWLALLD